MRDATTSRRHDHAAPEGRRTTEGGVMAETGGEKVWENRMRRMATRKGLRLVRATPSPGASDGGGWVIVDAQTNAVVAGPDAIGRPHWSLEDVQRYLTKGGGE